MKGRDLKPGMLTTRGLILAVDMEHHLFEGKPAYTFISTDDAYMALIGSLELDAEYEILAEPEDPRYREVLTTIAREQMNVAKEGMAHAAMILAFLDGKD